MPTDATSRVPIVRRDCLDGRPRMMVVRYFGDHLLLDATADPAAYRVGWLDGDVPLADAAAHVRRWYRTVPATRAWPVKRRQRQPGVDADVIRPAFNGSAIIAMPDGLRRVMLRRVGDVFQERP